MSHKQVWTVVLATAAIVASPGPGVALQAGAGGDAAAAQVTAPATLSLACEVALALAAAPEHLREEAGVWAYDGSGYARHRESANGFDCIVNRDDPRALKPTCFDAEGARTIIPRIRFFGARLARGIAPDAIAGEVADAFADGRFERPSRAGVAYMLSSYNRPAGPGGVGWFPPHVMYYAPDLTNDHVGFSPDAVGSVPGLPFVAYQGPQGFLIAVDSGVAEAPRVAVPECEGEVDPPPA
jgi:hypothetical protein